MANILNWYEIHATDFQRAVRFYETVLGVKIHTQEMNGMKVGFMPQEGEAIGGAIMTGPGQIPSGSGIAIYFKGGDDLAGALSRVQPSGGKVIMPKTLISKQIGHVAQFHDTEGNRVGLHSMG